MSCGRAARGTNIISKQVLKTNCVSARLWGKFASMNNAETLNYTHINNKASTDLRGNKNRFESYSTFPNMFSKTVKSFLIKNNLF